MKSLYFLLLFLISVAMTAQEQYAVYFDTDKDEANTPSAEHFMNWIAENNDAEIISINAFADSVGDYEYNIGLSQRRADYVLRQLKNNNAKISVGIIAKGSGETNAFSANKSSDRIAIIHYNRQIAKVKPETNISLTDAMKYARIGEKLRLDNLNFYGDTGTPLPKSMPVLKELLEIMVNNPNLQIEIQGHICCDPRNTKGVDEMRVKTVYQFLVKNGIDEDRLHYRTFGTTRPLYPLPEKSEEQRIANRRVEIEIMAQ